MPDSLLVPLNDWPVSQAALHWLQVAKEPVDRYRSYLFQLAQFGLDNGLSGPRPLSPSQPLPESLEQHIGLLLEVGQSGEWANQWLFSNLGTDPEEQRDTLAIWLDEAESPIEAAKFVMEMVHDRMVAASSY